MTIGRDEAGATRSVGREGTIPEKMRLLVGSRSLSTIVEVSTETGVVVVTDFIDGIFTEVAVSVEVLMENFGISSGMTRRGNSDVEKKLVDRRRGAWATTRWDVVKSRVVDVEIGIIVERVIQKNSVSERHTRDMVLNGVHLERESVIFKEILETVVISKRQTVVIRAVVIRRLAWAERRSLSTNGVVVNSFDNRRRRGNVLETRLETRLVGTGRRRGAKRGWNLWADKGIVNCVGRNMLGGEGRG
jgi:hypothetical protein